MFVDFHILNELGTPAMLSNILANRPAAGQTGRLFVSTNTFELYRDNGTGWDLIGGPGSSTVVGTGAAGQVTYWSGTNTVTGNNNLFWDIANERLGIGTTTPGHKLQINGTGTLLALQGGSDVFMLYHGNGADHYQTGYHDGSADYRRFAITDMVASKEVITIDGQSRYVGINYQYSSLADQPQYTFDVFGSGRFTSDLRAGSTAALKQSFQVLTDTPKISTQLAGADWGLVVDFSTKEMWLGDSVNGWGYWGGTTSGEIKIGDFAGNFGEQILFQIDPANGWMKTTRSGDNIGLKLDFVNKDYFLGDIVQANNGTFFEVYDDVGLIQTGYTGSLIGLKLDFINNAYFLGNPINQSGFSAFLNGNGVFEMGDFNNIQTYFQVDLNTSVFSSFFNGSETGLKLDFANSLYWLGDYNYNLSGVSFVVNDIGESIYTKYQGSETGLKIDFANKYYNLKLDDTISGSGLYQNLNDGTGFYQISLGFRNINSDGFGYAMDFGANYYVWLGDWSGQNNSTAIYINDNDTEISFASNAAKYRFYNVLQFANNAAALTGGLGVGMIYRITGTDQLGIVH